MEFESDEFNLLALNHDCLENIFSYLPLELLCAVGGTCKRLQNIAGQYFRRKYPAKQMCISYKSKKIDIQPSGIEHFSRFVQNIQINGSEIDVFKFANENCSENVRKISIFGGYMLTPQHIEHLKRFLSNAKEIRLLFCVFTNELVEFFQCCNSMEILIVKPFLYECQCDGREGGWLEHHYATLKHFEYDVIYTPKDFEQFVQLNPNVQLFSASSSILQQLYEDSRTNFIEIELQLKPSKFIDTVCDHFNALYEQQRFDRLHVSIDDKKTFLNNTEKITSLRGVDKVTLHFYLPCAIEKSSLQTLAIWPNLRILNMQSFGAEAEFLSQKLQQLEILRVVEDSLDTIAWFIRNSSNMRQLFIGKIVEQASSPCFSQLNIERLKLNNWRRLNLYISESAFIAVKRTKYQTIEIKLIDSHF